MNSNVPYPCGICLKEVTNRQMGAQCRGNCERWFHKDCAKISTTDYTRLSSDEKYKWECLRADCVPKGNDHYVQLLGELKKLSDAINNVSQKVDNIKTSELAEIKTDIKSVTSKLESIENRLVTSEKRIDSLEVKVESMAALGEENSVNLESFIAEFKDREMRANNVILYNVPECDGKTSAARQKFDKEIVTKIVNSLKNVSVSIDNLKVYRIGKPKPNTIRPIKVVFGGKEEMRSFISSFDPDALRSVDAALENTTISRDRTVKEREFLSKVKSELAQRVESGEENLTIKFINGIPTIVEKGKKN
jgi:hypothetical protein